VSQGCRVAGLHGCTVARLHGCTVARLLCSLGAVFDRRRLLCVYTYAMLDQTTKIMMPPWRLPYKYAAALRETARARNLTVTACLVQAVAAWLDSQGGPGLESDAAGDAKRLADIEAKRLADIEDARVLAATRAGVEERRRLWAQKGKTEAANGEEII
jgi:hypothetical protein